MLFTLKHLFTPHYSNNHRARILHPVGLSVLVGVFVLSQSCLQLLRFIPSLPNGLILGYASNITASRVVELTNVERSKNGLPPLTYNSKLSDAAAKKAAHMFTNGYWAHIAPDGTTPWVFFQQAGYGYSIAGENLARDFDSTDPMVSAWMTSPTHRDNIVNQKYQEIGVAVVDGVLQGVETTLVVQLFGAPIKAIAVAKPSISPQSAETKISPKPATPTNAPTVAIEPTIPADQLVYTLNEPDTETQPETAYENNQSPEIFYYNNALGTTLSQSRTSMFNSTLISPLAITKAISTSIIILVMGVLLYDLWYIRRKQIPRFVGKNWAHLTFLSLVLILIWGLAQGKVL